MNVDAKKYIDKEINHLWCKIDIKIKEQDKASKEARRLMEYRLENMNELREQLNNAELTFLTKSEYATRHQLVENEIKQLSKYINLGIGIILLAQVIVGAFIYVFFQHLAK